MTDRYRGLCVLLTAFSIQLHAQPAGPSQAELRYLSSVLPLIQSRAWPEAEAKLTAGLTEFPRSAVLSNALGMVYEQENKNQEAMRAFEEATEWLPNFTAAQLHLASLLAKAGDCDRADPLFVVAGKETTDLGALSAAGVGLAECKDYADAVVVLERAHSLSPQLAATTFNLARAQFEQGNVEGAFNTISALPPGPEQDRPAVLFLRGKLLQALKRNGSGAIMLQACRARPEEDYCNEAAAQLIREEQFLKAADLINASLPSMPPSATALSTLGLAQFRLGRYRDAIASYSKAIELDPRLEAPREGLAFLLYMTGDLERARSVVEQALSKGNSDFYLPYLHALVLYRMGGQLRPESLSSLAKAMKQNPGFAPSYFLRGKIRADQGDLDGALQDFARATELDPQYALPYYKMAQIYLRQGRSEEAEKAHRQFSKLGSMREEEVLARQAQNQLLSQSR